MTLLTSLDRIELLRRQSRPFSMALILSGFESEHEELRSFGYDLSTIHPFRWQPLIFSLWERAANLASRSIRRHLLAQKDLAPELVVQARQANRVVSGAATSITETTLASLTGLAEFEIDELYDGWELTRAPLIADTEARSAIAWGDHATAVQIAPTKLWRTQEDGDVRDSHNAMAGVGPIPVFDVFPNGLAHAHDRGGPIEEWINCRCWIEYA